MFGGILIHLACGSMYCLGNLISYLPAHLKHWSPEGGDGAPDAGLVLALILMAQMAGMPLGPAIEAQIGPRFTAMLGGLMMGSGLWLASYATKLLDFVLSYTVMFGLGVGIAYQMPFITGSRWFPDKVGTVQGAVISGVGASAFVFNSESSRRASKRIASPRSTAPRRARPLSPRRRAQPLSTSRPCPSARARPRDSRPRPGCPPRSQCSRPSSSTRTA